DWDRLRLLLQRLYLSRAASNNYIGVKAYQLLRERRRAPYISFIITQVQAQVLAIDPTTFLHTQAKGIGAGLHRGITFAPRQQDPAAWQALALLAPRRQRARRRAAAPPRRVRKERRCGCAVTRSPRQRGRAA